MKLHFPTLALLAALLFASCSRDKTPDPEPATQTNQNTLLNLIPGKWKVAFNAEDLNNNHQLDENEKEFPIEGRRFYHVYIDGTGIAERMSSPPRPLSWVINGRTIALKTQNEDGSWEDPENYYAAIVSHNEMLWQDSADSASFFVGFVK